MSLPEALERAAAALPDQADLIRPANGDPVQLLSTLDPAGCQRVLAWLLANEPAAGEELTLEWCEDDRGVERVQSIEIDDLPKSGKKILRKALHRLRTSGVEIAAPKPAKAATVPRRSDVSDEMGGAYLTSVDPSGSVLLFLVEANPSGGVRLFQISLDERRGVVEFDIYATGRSKTRSFLRKLTDASATGASGAVEVDAAFARGLVARIAAIHPKTRPFPRAFSEWRRKLEAGSGDVPAAALASETIGAGVEASQDALERVAERIRARELGPWPPEASRLSEVAESLGRAVDAIVSMTGETRERALDEAVQAATQSLFEGNHSAHTVSRFELSAYVASVAGRSEEARDLLVAAESLGEPDGFGANPVARAMTESFMASVLKRVEDASTETSNDTTPPEES